MSHYYKTLHQGIFKFSPRNMNVNTLYVSRTMPLTELKAQSQFQIIQIYLGYRINMIQ